MARPVSYRDMPHKAVNSSLKSRSGKIRVPRRFFNERLVSKLIVNSQSFKPRDIGADPGLEIIFGHTIKDFIVTDAFLQGNHAPITVNSITFPPKGFCRPTSRIRSIIERAEAEFHLKEIRRDKRFMDIMKVFILYHDIAKRTGNRKYHERKGAVQFDKARDFMVNIGLSERDVDIVSFLIRFHGLYGQRDNAIRKGLRIPSYSRCIKHLDSMPLSPIEKLTALRILFFFNIVEGMQSDAYSKLFFGTDKAEDIIRTYHSVVSPLLEQ